MAGNANSGNRNGGKSITEMIQRSAKKAIRQGEAGLGGKRKLDELLGDLMQNDVSAFLKAVSPFVPRELVIDQSISITVALEEARQRVIQGQVIDSPQLIEQQTTLTVPCSDQSDVVCVDSSQGGV